MSRIVFSILAVGIAVWCCTPTFASDLVTVPGDAATLTAAASLVGDGGVIEIAGGTWPAPGGGFDFDDLGKGFTVRAAAGATVILDGGGAGPVMTIMNSVPSNGRPIIFEAITFFDGLSATNGIGGGVTVAEAVVTFVDCLFDSNGSNTGVGPADTGGGGVFIRDDSTVFFAESTFIDNWARTEGGGLRLDASTAYVVDCLFQGNRVDVPNHRATAAGGGIHVTNGVLRVANTRFDGNRAGYVGGGLYALGTWSLPYSTPQADVVVANCTFVDNVAEPDASVTLTLPTEGGGVHGEDQTLIRIFNSRFFTNRAGNGGGVNLYRATVEVDDSVFGGNQATNVDSGYSTGWGGALAAISSDTTADGAENRPSASLTVRGCFVQGRYGAVTTVGQLGGGLFASGDVNRHWGEAGVSPTAGVAETRATVLVEDSVFVDCDVLEDPVDESGKTGSGGAVNVFHSTFTMDRTLIIDSDAIGDGTTGGAVRVVYCDAVINDSTIASSTAVWWGGALYLQATEIDITNSNILESALSGPTQQGTAIFAAPHENLYGSSVDIVGTISSSVIANSSSSGKLIFDDDRVGGPINDLHYVDNILFDQVADSDVYRDPIAGINSNATAVELNSLVVTRNEGVSTTDKGSGNSDPGSMPVVAVLKAAPTAQLAEVAFGDLPGAPDVFLAWAATGGSASLDGSGASSPTGWQAGSQAEHTLVVGAAQDTATITAAPSPGATFAANPSAINGGGSADLSWSTPSGAFVESGIDHGVLTLGAASGVLAVSPTATTTYRLFTVTEEGGVVTPATVWVDEIPNLIFADGFESGDIGSWS